MNTLIRQSLNDMTGYVPGEQPTETDIIKLNTNENPYPPSPQILDVLKGTDLERLSLYPDPTSMQLRQKIAELHGCSADRIIVGNGSDEILTLCMRAFVEWDGCIGYFEPSYSLYPVLADIADVDIDPVELTADFGWTMPEDYDASLFFLSNPNAPTGNQFDVDTVRRFAQAFPGVTVIDEAYADFADQNCADLGLNLSRVVVVRSLSKAYSLAGIRLGYAIGPVDLISAMNKVKDSYNVNVLTQRIGFDALSDQAHKAQNISKIKATRERVASALTDLGWQVNESQTNFLWCRPSADTAENVFEGLRSKRILVRYFPGERTGDYLRITIGTDEQMDAFLAALSE